MPLALRARGDGMRRPRRLAVASVRPLNFTVEPRERNDHFDSSSSGVRPRQCRSRVRSVRARCRGRRLEGSVMRFLRCAPSLLILLSLSGCIEITTYVSPSASGTVVDAATKKPIQGATISVDDHPGLFTQTNSDGQFSLAPTTRTTHIFWLAPYRSLPPGGTVVVSADGYASKEVAVNGNAGPLLVSLLRVR
jgi:hypothetical protein